MDTIKYACILNNQGVDLLVSGEYSRASKVFQSALSLLKAVHEAETETTSCANEDDSTLPFHESTSTVSELQGLHCYVYDHGIMISDNAMAILLTKQYLSTSQSFFLIRHWRLTPKGRHSDERNH